MTSMAASSSLRMVTFKNHKAAIAVAVRLMLRYPAFARQPFGEWAGSLDSQARRGHQVFFVDDREELRGFFGYALASQSNADAWASGGRSLTNEDCLAGDCLILNAWVSSDAPVPRLMVQVFRQLGRGKTAVHFKRFDPDASLRTACLANNDAVICHFARDSAFRKIWMWSAWSRQDFRGAVRRKRLFDFPASSG